MSFFERSLLEPNSARLMPGPEGYSITQLTPVLWCSRAFARLERGALCILCIPPLAFSAYRLTVPVFRTVHKGLSLPLAYRYWPLASRTPVYRTPVYSGILPVYRTPVYSGIPPGPFQPHGFDPLVANVNLGEKMVYQAPPVGTRVSFFERSLLEPNSARLTPGPEGYNRSVFLRVLHHFPSLLLHRDPPFLLLKLNLLGFPFPKLNLLGFPFPNRTSRLHSHHCRLHHYRYFPHPFRHYHYLPRNQSYTVDLSVFL